MAKKVCLRYPVKAVKVGHNGYEPSPCTGTVKKPGVLDNTFVILLSVVRNGMELNIFVGFRCAKPDRQDVLLQLTIDKKRQLFGFIQN